MTLSFSSPEPFPKGDKSIAVVPGSFDPLTLGHYDLIYRAASVFDTIVIGVLDNPEKKTFFSLEERLSLINKVFEGAPYLKVLSFKGLLVDFLASVNSTIIVRGLRGVGDYEYECSMAMINSRLSPHIETIFLSAHENRMFVSSSMVKQIATLGGDISLFVPPLIRDALMSKLQNKLS